MFNRGMVFFFFFITVCIGNVFADTISFALEITGINVNQGQVHVKIYANERDYRSDTPYATSVLASTSASIIHSFDIPEGEYVISLFQDTNNNGRSDTNILGMPREPVALSNHTRGIPGGFNKLKIPVNATANSLTMNLRQI